MSNMALRFFLFMAVVTIAYTRIQLQPVHPRSGVKLPIGLLRPGNTSDPLCPPACSEGENVQERSANAISNVIFCLHTVVNADVSHGVPYLAELASTLLCREFDTHELDVLL